MALIKAAFGVTLAALAILCAKSAHSEKEPNACAMQTAYQYLEAYTQLDMQTLEKMYSPDVVFIDPTSLNAPNIAIPVEYQGKADVLAFISSLEGNLIDARYDLDRTYESSGQVVFVGDAVFTFAGQPHPITYKSAIVTVISVQDCLVASHTDYADYNGMKQISSD